MTKKITIGIIDDDVLFAEALELLLQTSPSLQIVFRVSDSVLLFREIATNGIPDVLLTDLKLKNESGLDIFCALKEKHPDLKAVALSGFYKPVYVAAALRSGFSAFLPKNCESKELISALLAVHETGLWYRPADLLLIQGFLRMQQPAKPDFDETPLLSAREKEIIQLICMQYTNAEIADKLYLSVRTVEGHRNRILEKTGIRNSVGLVVFALSNNIADISEMQLRMELGK